MKTEHLTGRLDDGTTVAVIKQTAPLPDAPQLDGLPRFKVFGGEPLTQRPGDTDLTRFVGVHSGRNVTIAG